MRNLSFALTWVWLGLASAQTIFTSAGLPYSHRDVVDGKPAVSSPLNNVYGLLFDKVTGRLLFHDEGMVFRLEPDGSLVSVVGMGRGNDGTNTNGTLASALNIYTLRGMVQDATGALYLSEAELGRVYRVGLDGVVRIFAGGGTIPPGQGDGGPAINVALGSPRGLVFDSHGNLDIAEAYCFCIRQVNPAGAISTLFTLPQQPGYFQYFEGLAIDAQDNVYATEYRGSALWKITPSGAGTVIAGTGVPGFSGDGGPAISAQLNGPSGVTLDSSGNIYITDSMNNRVRRIAPDGTISTFAGTGVGGYSGDSGAAMAAQLFIPAQTVIDSAGNVYISDYNNRRVRVVSTNGIISTVAGSGVENIPLIYPNLGDGGPALNALFNVVSSAAFGPAGDLYVADMNNDRVRRIGTNGVITTLAGSGTGTFTGKASGIGGLATEANFSLPVTVVTDQSGSVYFETLENAQVLKVTPDGILHLVAGSGPASGPNYAAGDGGLAVNATLLEPKGLAVDTQGNVYIADTSNARLRKVDTNGIITTIAGPGILGTDYWNAVALDPQGNVYVAITHAAGPNLYSVVDRVGANGSLTPVAGSMQNCANQGPVSFTGEGAPATQVPLCVVVGLTFDAQGNMYIPESFYNVVLKVAQDGTVHRIAGATQATLLGDGGPPLQASLAPGSYYSPASIAFDASGNLFLPQSGSNRIREVIPGSLTVQFSVGRVDFVGSTPQLQGVKVITNIAEPLPFSTQITTTGGNWLSTNRVTGQTGDTLTISANPAGLASGAYSGSIQITVPGTTASPASLSVTLTVQ